MTHGIPPEIKVKRKTGIKKMDVTKNLQLKRVLEKFGARVFVDHDTSLKVFKHFDADNDGMIFFHL